MKNLQGLYLSNNQLTSIPAELAQLKNLQRLDLSYNRLTSIPAELAQLKNLQGLELGGNPLQSPPPEVVKQDTKAVLAYLWELAKGQKKRYEAKLLILGDANEGKTCVSRALRGLPFEQQVTTEGVDIEPWEFEHPDYPKDEGKRIRLSIWDFEGQEINHQSHQFFLTQRSLYLEVFKGREKFERDKVQYWLDTIRSRAPGSEVMLVATECESRTPHVPMEELRIRYPGLLKYENFFFEVGCATGRGVGSLKEHLQKRAAQMELMGIEWPDSYANAENEIKRESEKHTHISRVVLHKIFERSGIEKGHYEGVAELFGDTGVITHFPNCPDLGDFVVLKPQWLTKAMSYILENKDLAKNKGEITHEELHDLWERRYKGLSRTLHDCMREFELCYNLDYHGRHLSLVPLRFGFVRPKKMPWSAMLAEKERRIEYRFNVTPPAGIMSRFIVKTHHMIAKTPQMPKGVYWYDGVFLRAGEAGREDCSEALCEFDRDKRTLRFTVRAAFPQNMAEQLNGFAQAVFNFFEGLKPERYYGCIKVENAQESQCEGMHSERRILSALAKKRIIDCEFGWHDVEPMNLVYGFSSFGEAGLAAKDLREQLDQRPAWAEGLVEDVRSSLVWIDKTYGEVSQVRRRQEKLSAELGQKVELGFRDYLRMLNEMLDNRAFNSAPAVVSIVPVDGSKFNPKNWFEKEYVLRPYCEDETGVHLVDFSIRFTKPREWWEKTAPKLVYGVKILSAGLKIGFAGLPLAIGDAFYDAMKNEVEFMKELTEHLELEGGAESNVSDEAGEVVERLNGGRPRDLRQVGRKDEKRIARMQLARLLEEIAPDNYKAWQWGPLMRVPMPDNTYRWLCKEHARLCRR